MAYKTVKSCMNCEYFEPWEDNILVGKCSRHNDLMTNIFFTCYIYKQGKNVYNLNEYEKRVVEAYKEQDKLMNINIGKADVFTQSNFLNSNKFNVRFIDSCNNCRYFDQFKDTAFSGKCKNKGAFIADVLHICENFMSAMIRLKIIHPPLERDFHEK